MKIFLDTNIFLHYPDITNIDWCRLLHVPKVELVMCMQVVHELDEKKDHATLSKRANKALKLIKKIISSENRLVRDHVTLSVFQYELRNSDFPETLSPDSKDDRIVHTVQMYLAQNPEVDLFVCSEDVGMFLRCKAFGIKVLELENEQRLPNPNAELEKKNQKLASDLAKLKNLCPRIEVSMVHLDEGESLNDNDFSFRVLQNPDPYNIEEELRKKEEKLKAKAMEINPSFSPLLGSRSSHQGYLNEVDAYLTKYRVFLEESNKAYEQLGEIIRIKVDVSNQGSTPATELALSIELPDNFQSIAYGSDSLESILDDLPESPDEPKLSDFSSLLGRTSFAPRRLESSIADFSYKDRPSSEIETKQSGGFTIKVTAPRLVHYREMSFGDYYLRFNKNSPAQSFQSKVTVTAGNMPIAQELIVNCIYELQ